MAAATLTSALIATHSYSSLAITASPSFIPSGEVIFVSQGLPGVELFVANANVHIGDVSIPIVTHVAVRNHNIGDNVAPKFSLTAVGRTTVPVETPRTRRL